MRHCCEFDAYDIWYLKESDEFSDRVMFIGDCPICNKHVVILSQRNKKTNTFLTIKKVGECGLDFSKKLISEIVYSKNSLNKMKFQSRPYGWKYGLNKEKKNKNGSVTVEQYAKDFFGNKELVKKEER